MARVEVRGLKELGENIRKLSEETRRKIAPAMTGAAASVVKRAVVKNAPQSDEAHEIENIRIEPGNLKKNIIAVKIRKPGELTAEHIVTARGGVRGKFASRYGSMKEHGTVKMPAEPWLRPAIDQNVGAAINAMKARGEKRVAAAAKSLSKSGR